MRQPSVRGTPINMQRMRRWTSEFSGYRNSVNEHRIDRWLEQFSPGDRDLAGRILDAVDFISYQQMGHAFRDILGGLDGWNIDPARRRGKWRFVPFSSSAGESGDMMIHKFRHATNMTGRQYRELFIYRRDLLGENLSSDDTVVFVDDFAGTGTQICDAWKEQFQELLPNNPRAYLVLVVASETARHRISEETELTVVTNIELSERDNIFSELCGHFSTEEKSAILHYCEKADRHNPRGFGDCGYVLVFAHSCPNNSIPILHTRNQRWEGLFPRYD